MTMRLRRLFAVTFAFGLAATNTAFAQQVPHDAGELITETDAVRAHYLQEQATKDPADCGGYGPHISLVIKQDWQDQAALDQDWLGPVMAEIAPAVKQACPKANRFVANIFMAGVYFDRMAAEWSRADIARGLRREVVFGKALVSLEGGAPAIDRILPFGRTPSGGVLSTRDERITLTGLRALRDRGWRTIELANRESDRAARQKAALGVEIPSPYVWAIYERGEEFPWLFDGSHAYSRYYVWASAQAYGRAAIEICGDEIPGGVTEKTFTVKADDGRSNSASFHMPTALGRAAHNNITGRYSGGGVIHVFHSEAKKGPIRDSMNLILRHAGCMSDIHKRLHRNILAAVESQGLR